MSFLERESFLIIEFSNNDLKNKSQENAILTACRGLDIPVDEAQPLSAMVPMSRGHVYTLDECENGDEEKGYEPAPELIKALKAYPNLYAVFHSSYNLERKLQVP